MLSEEIIVISDIKSINPSYNVLL